MLIAKVLTKKMGDLMVPQIHIACWTRLRVFSDWGNRCAECWWSKFQLQKLGTRPFMVKGCQHWVFLDNEALASKRVPVFKFLLCPGPLDMWGRAADIGSQCSWRSKFCVRLGSMTCSFHLLSLKSNLAFH